MPSMKPKALPTGMTHASIAIDALMPHPRNYRSHPESQVERLSASLARFGQVRSIVVQAGADGRYLIVAGHGLAEAAKREGLTELHADVIPAHWTAEAIEGYLIADNESSREAEDDLTALAAMLEEQRAAGYHLESLGYSDDDLAALLAQLADEQLASGTRDVDDPDGGGDEFDTTPEEGPTRCQLGDLWQLGNHRLLCGDSTKREDVARLMAGASARLICTDPPYGVGYVGGTQDSRSPNYRMGLDVPFDSGTSEQTEDTVAAALSTAAAHCENGAAAYVLSPPGDNLPHFIAAMDRAGFAFRHSLVWVKDSFVFGRTDYHYQHEMILYGWIENGAHYWAGDRTLGSVFEIPRPKRSEEHPTMKPIALIAIMITNSSQEGDVIYEPFAGSGTALIACERLNRRCHAVEITPRFADVILRRWEVETGRDAVLLERIDRADAS